MTEISQKDHITPALDDDVYYELRRASCVSWFGHLFKKCGYCGEPHNSQFVCDCGFQLIYNNSGDLVWSDGK